ncbi:ribosome small subunit-dependent GTPase A [Halosquirtibacter laminarini]|uniref:Ribosome small subunit-dependent GTPase A n=1 Tax=Halosquirtibacter laminarini TaxID=3374600 RepID=A0AC61NFJ6_9BACT|nr:ribosome small subunit-dependent GTPase A [Prolixibacteraceae bacterium]
MITKERSYRQGYLGYNSFFDNFRQQEETQGRSIGRITAEHRDRYTISTENETFEGEIIGSLRYTATTRHDLPIVGDWVSYMNFDDHKAIIYAVAPRNSILERKDKLIASNIDGALVVTSPNRDFNIPRLERYLSLCRQAKITPFIVVNKIDLISETQLEEIKEKVDPMASAFFISCLDGYTTDIISFLKPHKTYIMLGSSGVGKSTLINTLLKKELLKTSEISSKVQRGKHQTTARELMELLNQSYIIDNPGIREVGLTSSKEGIEDTFKHIEALASSCQYKNCMHQNEKGCAVLEGIEEGVITQDEYNHYMKLNREVEHYRSTEKERKDKAKKLSKLIRKVNNR